MNYNKFCPICENELRIFIYTNNNKVTEKIKQCRTCDFSLRILYNKFECRIKDYRIFIFYSRDKFNKKNEHKKLKKLNKIVNKYRKELKKSDIKYFPRLKKICSYCGKLKYIKHFFKENHNIDKHTGYCKVCSKKNLHNYSLSFNGWLSNSYHLLKIHQKKRFENELNYTKQDLKNWIDINLFNTLWEEYKHNNYSKKGSVILLRIDFNKDYNLDNLKIMKFSEAMREVKQKVDYKKQNTEMFARKVAQSKNGITIKIFLSIREAARNLNGDSSAISKVCQGKYSQHKGFEWRYI